MFDFPFDNLAEGFWILLVILLLVRGKRLVNYIVDAIARAIVKSINGQLGLDGIRNDVSSLKVQVGDLEKQLEVILTDIE